MIRLLFLIPAIVMMMNNLCLAADRPAQDASASTPIVALIEMAEKGNKNAQYDVGVIYLYGRGVPKDENKAFEWFNKAAASGYSVAEYAVGRMYYYGQGIAQSGKLAQEWFQKAAEKGNADAQYALGVMYQFGKDVEKNLETAAKWYRSAAESGLAAAQYALGAMYSLGQGVEKDLSKGIEWLKKSSAQKYQPAVGTLLIIESNDPNLEIKIRDDQIKLSDSL